MAKRIASVSMPNIFFMLAPCCTCYSWWCATWRVFPSSWGLTAKSIHCVVHVFSMSDQCHLVLRCFHFPWPSNIMRYGFLLSRVNPPLVGVSFDQTQMSGSFNASSVVEVVVWTTIMKCMVRSLIFAEIPLVQFSFSWKHFHCSMEGSQRCLAQMIPNFSRVKVRNLHVVPSM